MIPRIRLPAQVTQKFVTKEEPAFGRRASAGRGKQNPRAMYGDRPGRDAELPDICPRVAGRSDLRVWDERPARVRAKVPGTSHDKRTRVGARAGHDQRSHGPLEESDRGGQGFDAFEGCSTTWCTPMHGPRRRRNAATRCRRSTKPGTSGLASRPVGRDPGLRRSEGEAWQTSEASRAAGQRQIARQAGGIDAAENKLPRAAATEAAAEARSHAAAGSIPLAGVTRGRDRSSLGRALAKSGRPPAGSGRLSTAVRCQLIAAIARAGDRLLHLCVNFSRGDFLHLLPGLPRESPPRSRRLSSRAGSRELRKTSAGSTETGRRCRSSTGARPCRRPARDAPPSASDRTSIPHDSILDHQKPPRSASTWARRSRPWPIWTTRAGRSRWSTPKETWSRPAWCCSKATRRVVGKEAIKAIATEAEHVAQCAKRDLGERTFHK